MWALIEAATAGEAKPAALRFISCTREAFSASQRRTSSRNSRKVPAGGVQADGA